MNKLSYEHGSSNLPLLGETITERLRKTVELFGDRDALYYTLPKLQSNK